MKRPGRTVLVALRAGIAAAALQLTPALAGPPPSGEGQDLMRRADQIHKLATESARVTMTLEEQKGDKRVLVFDQLSSTDAKNGDKMRIRFVEPADVRGTTLLSVEPKQDAPADQWLYLPAFKKTRQVGGGEMGDRFVGSDLYYEDFKGRPVDDWRYTVTGTETLDGKLCQVLEGVPATPEVAKESPYGKVQVWLRKDILVPVRVRYFDRQLRPDKQADAGKLVQVKGAVWRADLLTIVDVKRKHRTVITVDQRNSNATLPADAFSRHAMEAE